ncbi:MAG: PDC sensor domain-containing protein [Deltaproteobacteria bacterium]|nr:PDC sensor domain-containing protein [Deltaproteobacteria bacterium]
MKTAKSFFIAFGIIFTCFLVCSVFSHAADTTTGKSGPEQGIRQDVEQKLGALSQEIGSKRTIGKAAAYDLLSRYLKENPRIYGAALAFAPKKKKGKTVKFSPYVYRSGNELIKKDLAKSYNYKSREWYAAPVKKKKPLWSEPYYDEGGGETWMVTYSIPVYSSAKRPKLIGVVTSDVIVPKP